MWRACTHGPGMTLQDGDQVAFSIRAVSPSQQLADEVARLSHLAFLAGCLLAEGAHIRHAPRLMGDTAGVPQLGRRENRMEDEDKRGEETGEGTRRLKRGWERRRGEGVKEERGERMRREQQRGSLKTEKTKGKILTKENMNQE